MICNVRIDDRLIHGQTVTMWIPHFRATHTVIVSDEIAHDETRKAILKMGCPQSTKLSIFSIDTAIEKLGRHINDDIRIMLLFNDPKTIVELIKKGLKIEAVTVGNMSNKAGAKSIRKTIFVTEKDKEALLELDDLGVKLISQMVPNELEDTSVIDDIRKA